MDPPTNTRQPLVEDLDVYPNQSDDHTLFQPYSSQRIVTHGQHAAAASASASGSAAPQPTQTLLPPVNIPIYQGSHGSADFQYRDEYDPSTNPYSQGMRAMPSLPPLWYFPSFPQVHVPPPFLQHRDSLLPANMQFVEKISSPFAGNLEPGVDIPPLPALPTNYGALALDNPNHSSNPTYVPYNMEAPVSVCPPDTSHPVSQMRDDIVNVGEPTQIKPPKIVSDSSLYPPYLSAFLPEFGQPPALSKGGDALLPPGCDDEPLRTPNEDMAAPQESSIFHFYGGPNDRRGRKGKRGARYMPELAHLRYDEKNQLHGNIVMSAKKDIVKHALNVRSLSDEEDRTALVENALKQAAIRFMNVKGSEWASYNSGRLYMMLSEPCKTIMHTCCKHACNLVNDGYDLRLSIWSDASECEHMENIIVHLLDDQIFPPNFVMGLSTDGLWHFLENEVVLNVILDTVRELKLGKLLKDVASLACTAAVAVCYALERAIIKDTNRASSDNEFSGAAFRDLYTRLMNYITEVIKKCPILRARWELYTQRIKDRLTK